MRIAHIERERAGGDGAAMFHAIDCKAIIGCARTHCGRQRGCGRHKLSLTLGELPGICQLVRIAPTGRGKRMTAHAARRPDSTTTFSSHATNRLWASCSVNWRGDLRRRTSAALGVHGAMRPVGASPPCGLSEPIYLQARRGESVSASRHLRGPLTPATAFSALLREAATGRRSATRGVFQ